MENKKFLTILIITLCFLGGGFFIHRTMENVNSRLEEAIVVQRSGMMREKALHALNVVQSDLLLKNSPFATNLNSFVGHVEKLDQAVASCFDCHHGPDVSEQLDDFAEEVSIYKSNISRVYTLRSNVDRLNRERSDAYQEGQKIVAEMSDMLAFASERFTVKLELTRKEILNSKKISDLLLILGPLFFLGVMLFCMRHFTSLLTAFNEATCSIKNGNLSYRIEKRGTGEIKELADGFNQMAQSLEDKCSTTQHIDQRAVVGELAAGLIHEVRKPLSGIKRSIEFLDGKLDLNEINKTLFQQIISEIERVGNILESLPSYAKHEQLQYKSVNINTILESALESTRYSLEGGGLSGNEKEISITSELDKYVPAIKADSSQLLQLFLNLLLQAVGISVPKGIVSASTSTQPSGHVQIEIADSGPPLSEAEVIGIFEPFFVTQPNGARQGLMICKQLVEQQGGTISVANGELGGAKFTILFPIK